MFDDEIKHPEIKYSSEEEKQKRKEINRAKSAERRAMRIASGEQDPRATGGPPLGTVNNPKGRPKSVVNRVTEYGALFNQLNQQRIDAGLPPLKTAMETLIEALQSDKLDIKDRARIAEKIASYESSRAPIISIEHVQNIVREEEEVSADDALDEFMNSLRKV